MPAYHDLATERPNPASRGLDRLDSAGIVALMNREDAGLAAAVAAASGPIAALIDTVAERLGRGGRLFYVGAGTSGRLGALDAAECPPTFGASPEQVQAIIAGGERALLHSVERAEDDAEAGAQAIAARGVGNLDVVLGISASGTAAFVLGALAAARAAGAATGLLCCAGEGQPAEVEHLIRVDTGPEVLAGSTRLKAGTATKMVLNMISTGAMVRLGKVYDNLMVDVQPTNRKLRDRARRILSAVTGLDETTAEAALADAGDLKTALVAALAGCSPDEARTRLAAAGGRVREATGR